MRGTRAFRDVRRRSLSLTSPNARFSWEKPRQLERDREVIGGPRDFGAKGQFGLQSALPLDPRFAVAQ